MISADNFHRFACLYVGIAFNNIKHERKERLPRGNRIFLQLNLKQENVIVKGEIINMFILWNRIFISISLVKIEFCESSQKEFMILCKRRNYFKINVKSWRFNLFLI